MTRRDLFRRMAVALALPHLGAVAPMGAPALAQLARLGVEGEALWLRLTSSMASRTGAPEDVKGTVVTGEIGDY